MAATIAGTIGLAFVVLVILVSFLATETLADDASVRDAARQFQVVIRDVGEPIL